MSSVTPGAGRLGLGFQSAGDVEADLGQLVQHPQLALQQRVRRVRGGGGRVGFGEGGGVAHFGTDHERRN